MKYILILLVSFAFGQDVPGRVEVVYDYRTQIDSQLITATHRILTPIYDTDLLDYAEECYNDSTVSYYTTMSDGASSWRTYCEKDSVYWWGKCPEIWTHKEPTFKGFIEWLKK